MPKSKPTVQYLG